MGTTTLQDKDLFGNPCPSSNWPKTIQECKNASKYNSQNLAVDVLRTFDININMNHSAPTNSYTSLCPLDIVNVDPLQVIRTALDGLLLQGEYWEVYADEFGEARFVKVLHNSSPNTTVSPLPEIRYCIPGTKMEQLVDLVIVRGSTPIPQFSCGDQEIIVLDPSQPIFHDDICSNQNIFTRSPFNQATSATTALGAKIEWGKLTRNVTNVAGVSDSCDSGRFRQFATVVYPEYDRKQVYKDNISDPIEIGPFQQIIAWIVDLDFVNFPTDELVHYNINFTGGSTEIPVRLMDGDPLVGKVTGNNLKDFFPAECDLSDSIHNQTCPTPTQLLNQIAQGLNAKIATPRDAMSRIRGWAGGYIVPNMYAYGTIKTCLNFQDANRWGYLGFTTQCGGDPIENIYQNSTQIIATGFPLRDWTANVSGNYYFFGIQTEHQTIQLPEGDSWVEIPYSSNLSGGSTPTWQNSDPHMEYALRFKAPPRATVMINWNGVAGNWTNPFYNYLGTIVHYAAPNESFLSANCWKYTPPGYLIGLNDGLWTIDPGSLYAKVNVSRPGLQIKSAGKDVAALLQSISMRVRPIYQYSMQQPIAACGKTFNQIINPETSSYDSVWCTRENIEESDMEKLKNHMNGITMDFTLSALFPTEVNDSGYKSAANLLWKVAQNLYNYYNTFRNEPYKGYTYVCGPPTTSDDIPRLGEVVRTPHGLRTVNSINYNYQDGQSYTLNVEVGPAMINTGSAGSLYRKKIENVMVKGKVVQVLEGALYKVDVPSYGVVTAWNTAKWPWEIGDTVELELYNVPVEA